MPVMNCFSQLDPSVFFGDKRAASLTRRLAGTMMRMSSTRKIGIHSVQSVRACCKNPLSMHHSMISSLSRSGARSAAYSRLIVVRLLEIVAVRPLKCLDFLFEYGEIRLDAVRLADLDRIGKILHSD